MKIVHFKDEFVELNNYDVSIDDKGYFKYLFNFKYKILNQPSREKFLHKLNDYSFIYNLTSKLYLTVKKTNKNGYILKVLIDFNNTVEIFENVITYDLRELFLITNKLIRKYKILDLNKDV